MFRSPGGLRAFSVPIRLPIGTWVIASIFVFLAHVARAEGPTYSNDIAPILRAKCQTCHRPGQIAPMSLLTYRETRPWASSIRKEVVAKRMPPFYAAGPIGHWKDDLRLTDAEIKTIADWVGQDAPRGNPAEETPEVIWPESAWAFGEPDLVVDFPEHDISTEGADERATLFSEFSFEEDMWLRGVVLVADQYDSLHHAHIFSVPDGFDVPPNHRQEGAMDVREFPYFYTWFPGLTVELLPEGQGIPVGKGSRIGLVTHFAPRTEPRKERIRLGLYWADGTIERVQRNVNLIMADLRIPPHQSSHSQRKTVAFEEDGWVTHFAAHMHLRGKSTQIHFRYPDGTSDLVFDLPQYSFDWQRYYYLSNPIRVPKDTVLEAVATWDNSANNPHNPDPSREVRWGPRTVDEMFGCNAYYTPVKTLSKPVVVKDGRIVQHGQID